MAKGKAKNCGEEDRKASPELQSLGSKKRGRPTDEPQRQLSPLQMCTIQQHQAAEEPRLTKQEENINKMVKTFEGQEETSQQSDPQQGDVRGHADNNADEDKEDITAEEECKGFSSQTRTDQPQVTRPTSEEDDRFSAEQLAERENSHRNLERNQETGHEDGGSVYTSEAAEVLPAKKKRRMGMCGLTEKERSHFLQTQKREKKQNGRERGERQIRDNTAEGFYLRAPSSSSSLLFIPVGSVTVQIEAEKTSQSSQSGEEERAETHDDVITSDITSAVCDPGCSKGNSCEAEGGVQSGPEQTGDTNSDPPVEQEVEEPHGNQDQQEVEGHAVEIMAEKPQEKITDGSGIVDQSPAITFYSYQTQNEEEEEDQDAVKDAPLEEDSVTRTRDENQEDLSGDAVRSNRAEILASSTDPPSGGLNCGSVDLCEALVTPSGSEGKVRCRPDDEPDAVNAENPLTEDTADPFGSECLDYVSDSQLNTIALIEEGVMEKEKDLGSTDSYEDASDLICGLIRELSSLNQKVMAAQRELENLRRSSKTSRSSVP